MTTLERRLVTITLIFGLLTFGVIAARGTPVSDLWQTPAAQAFSGTIYGVNESWLSTATADWPQQSGNWCGPADIEAVANYTYLAAGLPTPFPANTTPTGQQKIVNDLLSSAAISPWSYLPKNVQGNPGFPQADIAYDGGLDPRGLTWGIAYESVTGAGLHVGRPGYVAPHPATASVAYTFHNVVYHTSATTGLNGVARALAVYHQPVVIVMAHGLHFDIVSKVWATLNPATSTSPGVTAITTWDSDPPFYQPARQTTWDVNTFTTNSDLWGQPYAANPINGVPYDPDPTLGIYAPTSQYPTHWIGNYVTVQADTWLDVNVNFALDRNGNVLTHP